MNRHDPPGVLDQLARFLDRLLSGPDRGPLPAEEQRLPSSARSGGRPGTGSPPTPPQPGPPATRPRSNGDREQARTPVAERPLSEAGPDTVGEIALARGPQYDQLTAEQLSGNTQYGRFKVRAAGAEGSALIAMGYRRCRDFDQSDSPGQDFATVRADSRHVVGVVADGVSQSFFGDLAARFLGTELLDALWDTRENPPDEDSLEHTLEGFQASAAELVKRQDLPPNLPNLQRTALERIRAKGSQAVFAAFILDIGRRAAHIYQVGDVGVLVHVEGRPDARDVRAFSNGRWSTAGKSEFYVSVTSRRQINAMVVKTDGAGDDWGRTLIDDKAASQSFARLVEARAPVDDVAFVSVVLPHRTPAVETESRGVDRSPPPPEGRERPVRSAEPRQPPTPVRPPAPTESHRPVPPIHLPPTTGTTTSRGGTTSLVVVGGLLILLAAAVIAGVTKVASLFHEPEPLKPPRPPAELRVAFLGLNANDVERWSKPINQPGAADDPLVRFRIGIAAVRSLAFTRQGRETVTLKVPADLPTTRGGDRTFVASIPRGLVGRKGTLVTVKDANGDPVGASAANFPDTDATHYDIVISRVSR